MPGFNEDDNDDDKLAFQEWKKKWNIFYPTPDEDNLKFNNFKENIQVALANHPPPVGEPFWKFLNEFADRTDDEHFGCIRMDINLLSDDSDSDDEYVVYHPIKQDDGTIRCQKFYPPFLCNLGKFFQEEIQRQRAEKEDTKVKPQSTVPPVKRTSDDKDDTKEEDTVKRQKIGCGGQKQGCCSDCGK